VSKALSSDCKIHRALLLIVFPDLSLNERTPRSAHAFSKTLYLEKHWHGLFHFSVVDIPFERAGSSLTRMLSRPLALSKNNRTAAYRGSGRIVDPKWIDIRLVRNWKITCEVQHGDSCELIHNHSNISQHHPSLLVDTWRMCLTKNLSVKSYVALSYVWGPVPTLKTIQANLEAFQQTGCLRRKEINSKLPRTIRDAIALTELLQERYLWVDSLCIVQDDETSSHDQITKMASIYANAALTIVAADGEDANYGLRGIRGVSQPRSHSQQIGQLPHGVQIVERHSASYENSTWSKRGWTFQESLFSRRKLIFSNDCVRWLCEDWSSDEDLARSPRPNNTSIITITRPSYIFSLSWPDILRYQLLVNDFNRRDLTYPEDVINAFSGITTPLSKVFQGGFWYGLPELFFDVALLWHNWQPMTRRIPKPSIDSKLPLPSWSWMGWRGNIGDCSWGSGADYMKRLTLGRARRTPARTVPLVQWYGRDKHKIMREINPSWLVYRDFSMADSSAELPSGWRRYRYVPKNQLGRHCKSFPNPSVPKYFFKHDSDKTAEFWYPIPISGEVEGPESSGRYPFISCRTTRCWLYQEAHLKPAHLPSQAVVQNLESPLTLRDCAGTWAGILIVHSPIDPDATQCELKTARKTAEFELIAISRGFVFSENKVMISELLEWDHPERPKSFEIYEFYNVLWIEWEDEIAYRKGIGRVEKHMWESQPQEWIDVTLG
jgi:hypothetical protein